MDVYIVTNDRKRNHLVIIKLAGRKLPKAVGKGPRVHETECGQPALCRIIVFVLFSAIRASRIYLDIDHRNWSVRCLTCNKFFFFFFFFFFFLLFFH